MAKIKVELLDLLENDLRASVDEEKLQELANSIATHGQLMAIGVKPKPDGRFEVVFGARRTRAFRLLGLETCEANILKGNDSQQTGAKKLIENVQRENLTPTEEAYGLSELIGEGIADIQKLRQQTGKSREWLKTRLTILEMPKDLQGALQAEVITLGVAIQLNKITDDETRNYYLNAAANNGCTESQAANWVHQAQFVATGVAAATRDMEDNPVSDAEIPVVEMQLTCFLCKESHSWKQMAQVQICRNDLNQIVDARTNEQG